MCSIAGYSGNFDTGLLEQMNARLAHRGPDDSGTCVINNKGIGLAHCRLSIIDLSPQGHQPMWDAGKHALIVFNGELYNYQELRKELEGSGFGFKSHSDTEVLLNLYLRDGEAMLHRLNGIFAFAIWDVRKNSLFLARDGIGVKPLYYTQTPMGFLFASELKALLLEPTVQRSLNPLAIQSYLTFLWCPAPHTILQSIKKVKPGCAMLVRDGKIEKEWKFYDLPYQQTIKPYSVEEAVHHVQVAIKRAVARQMVADVPVGAFLSGGLDSSSVVAFAKEYTGSAKMQCFTMGFKGQELDAEGMTEDLPYAQKVARHLNVDLHTIFVGPESIDHLERMIYHMDEPEADPAALNVLFICQLAREHGIKVMLSGAGGDDIFTGYRRHYALIREKYWEWLPKIGRAGLKGLLQLLSNAAPSTRRLQRAFQYADLEGDERLVSYFFWTPPDVVTRLCKPLLDQAQERGNAPSSLLVKSLRNLPEHTPKLNRMLYVEAKHFLADHNLNYTDKMSMTTGVEVRVPLLDPDLVRLAAQLPLDYKQHGRTGKWIFKKAMEPYLPSSVIYRPKTGFGAPLRYWLRNQLKPLVDDVLSPTSVKRRGLFDPKAVEHLIAMDRVGKVDGTYTIFALLCLELWQKIFLEE